MAHIMTNKKRHVKWYHVEPKVAKLARKIIPASWFRGVKDVIATKNSSLLDILSPPEEDKDKIAFILINQGQVFLFLDRLKNYLKEVYGADYNKDKTTRRIVELGILAHELYHNEQKLEGRFYNGLYVANPFYRNKIEREADRKAKKLLENFKG